MERRHKAESKGCTAQSKVEVKQEDQISSASGQVTGECWGPVGHGLWKEAKNKEEKVKSELCGRHSGCHWVEVRKRTEKMERSAEKQAVG
jgi:hypothetical protein